MFCEFDLIWLENLRKKLSEKPKNSKLSYQEAEELSGIMEDIRKTLEAETEGHFVYKVSDKRHRNPRGLCYIK